MLLPPQAGIRIIITFTNYWPEYGGMQWYVDNIVGPGKPQELFYTDIRVIAAYQKWVRAMSSWAPTECQKRTQAQARL